MRGQLVKLRCDVPAREAGWVLIVGSVGRQTDRPESTAMLVSVQFGSDNNNLEVFVERGKLEKIYGLDD